ncbi:MAG: MCE family protein [Rhodospirillaceae bacterium]|nr:MCE family protein [Rhodospirillaceae bacterium]MBT5455442.1 MCE family protein [Rhodospirillaceae bacterium]
MAETAKKGAVMLNKNMNYGLLGLFVITMIAIAIGATIILSGRGGSYDRYVVLFENVADIKFGTQVRYEGYPVGQVEDIRPVARDGAMVFHLDIGVLEGWKIPADSVATIGSSTFLGAKTVDIRRGKAKASLAPGAQIASAPSPDMFAAMASIAGDFGELSKNSLRPMVERVAGLVANVDGLIANDFSQFVKSINMLAAGLQGEVPQIAHQLLTFSERLNKTLGSVQTMLSDQNVQGVGHVVSNVEQVSRKFVAISGTLDGTLNQINGIVANVDRLVKTSEGQVNTALKDTQYILQSLARNIDNFNHNISGTARNMNEFSRLIRQNPGLLLGGSSPDDTQRKDVPVSAPQ